MPELTRGGNDDISTDDVYAVLAGSTTPEKLRERRYLREMERFRWRERGYMTLAALATLPLVLAWAKFQPPNWLALIVGLVFVIVVIFGPPPGPDKPWFAIFRKKRWTRVRRLPLMSRHG